MKGVAASNGQRVAGQAVNTGTNGARAGTAVLERKRTPFVFVKEFFRSPKELGTCFKSSNSLRREMAEGMGIETADVVIEFGPGDGPITEEILAKLKPGAKFFAIETNEGLVEALRKKFPQVHVYIDSAENVARLCEREGIRPGEVDVIVSSIPFLLFEPDLQGRILRAAASVLRPGGRFATITYRPAKLMPSVRQFKGQMESAFSRVWLKKKVMGNIPPAYVYAAER